MNFTSTKIDIKLPKNDNTVDINTLPVGTFFTYSDMLYLVVKILPNNKRQIFSVSQTLSYDTTASVRDKVIPYSKVTITCKL